MPFVGLLLFFPFHTSRRISSPFSTDISSDIAFLIQIATRLEPVKAMTVPARSIFLEI